MKIWNLEINKNGYSTGIIDGEMMETIIDMFPELEGRFTQRQGYNEYYNDLVPTVELTMGVLEKATSYGYCDIILRSNTIVLSF